MNRNKKGKFTRTRWREFRYQTRNLTKEILVGAVGIGIVFGIFIDILKTPYVYEYVYAESDTPIQEYGQPVRIEVVTDWTRERIIQEIRDTFPESPGLAVAIARCESKDLQPAIQSEHILWYGRELSFGLMQIHEPVWGHVAERLGYTDWKTDPYDNLQMARYIYDEAGGKFTDWTCYNEGLYKKYL